MFRLALLLIVGCTSALFAADVQVQTGDTNLPMYRPALVGTGPDAIINTIDTKALVQQGQKDAALLFSAWVTKTGELLWSATYHKTPGADLLEKEVLKRLNGAHFIPGVYNHQRVETVFFGSVFFAIIKDKPRLRIYANQEKDELKFERDFIAPQPVIGGESRFHGFNYPEGLPVAIRGEAALTVKVSATGELQDVQIANEDPPFMGLGQSAMVDLHGARFIPAFRDGKPVESTTTLPVFFRPE